MSQMALPLGRPAAPGADAFIQSASSAHAVRMLEGWRDWPVRAALLTGPPRSGRSLLARIFAGRTGGCVIDDAAGVAEEALFHAWNAAQDGGGGGGGGPLLIVADAAPPAWNVALPDLRTRLAASPHAAIGTPDDALAPALFVHHFEARGLPAPAELVDWLVARTERSHAAIERIVAALDTLSLERHRRLTIPLSRTLLIEAGLLPRHPEDA